VTVAALIVAVGVVGYFARGLWSGATDVQVNVTVPVLSPLAEAGRAAYDRRCVPCHGVHGAGTAAGPPLVHPTYRSTHHADVAFTLAVARGVRAHHWRFGDMPPQPGVTPDELAGIVAYVRELQRANGID
jgi:mono/diheme cytochrome c family protein